MVQDYLEIPVAVENVSSYAAFTGSQMTEWEFLTEVVERADCGILLDVNNIYVSAMNHEFNPMDYVNAVPAHRVAQIHIAGHSKYEKYILDTHDHPVIDPVWQLYARAIERCGPTPTLLEWDDHIPSFDEVHAEAKKAERYLHADHNQHQLCPGFNSPTHPERVRCGGRVEDRVSATRERLMSSRVMSLQGSCRVAARNGSSRHAAADCRRRNAGDGSRWPGMTAVAESFIAPNSRLDRLRTPGNL